MEKKELGLHYYHNKGAVPVKIKTYELPEVLGAFTIKSRADRIIDNTGSALIEFNYLSQIKKSEIIINPDFWYGSTYKYLGQIHELIYNSGKL